MQSTLNNLKINTPGTIEELTCSGQIRQRLLDLGAIKSTSILPVFRSITGDPTAYEIRGTLLAIRNDDSKNIIVKF